MPCCSGNAASSARDPVDDITQQVMEITIQTTMTSTTGASQRGAGVAVGALETGECRGTVKTTRKPCKKKTSMKHDDNHFYCSKHQSQGDCMARVASGPRRDLRCEYRRKEPSRWCNTHYNGWHEKETPIWT